MKSNLTTLQSIFQDKLTASILGIPTEIFEEEEEVRQVAEERGFDSVLFGGHADLWVYDKWLDDSRELENGDYVDTSESFLSTFSMLLAKKRLFYKTEDSIFIITLSDLNRIPTRIWMFGVLSVFELTAREHIEDFLGSEWTKYLNNDRLEKAHEEYRKKVEKNEQLDLIDCIQLSDIFSIYRSSSLDNLALFGMKSYEFKRFKDTVIDMRNELMHSSYSFTHSWEEIYMTMNKATQIIDTLQND